MRTRDLLTEHGIPFKRDESRGEEWVVVEADHTELRSLRKLGFRLGRGTGQIQYLMYFRGRFCGIVI